MKALLMFAAALISLPILLIAGFQLVRLVINELTDLVKEAWNSPESHAAN